MKGRVAIVTGAAGGFGRVLVRGMLERGASVAALDVTETGLAVLRDSLREHGERLWCDVTDIADYDACARSVAEAMRRLGGVHALINNAAMGMNTIREDSMENLVGIRELSPQLWNRFIAVNFTGAWNMTRVCIEPMLAQRWGRIIDVTTSFFTMLRGSFQPYGPSKAGMEAMAAAHAKEFEGTGVTVNVVVPGGPADTPMIPDSSPLKRQTLIPPSAMVAPIVWLCSDAADGITGNRYVAAEWDPGGVQADEERRLRGPIAWPQLAQSPVWPGGKPNE